MTLAPALAFLKWDNLVSGHQFALHEPMSGQLTTPGVFVILGPNGCGKSTLLRTLLGVQKPLSGTSKRSGQLAYVPQSHKVNHFFHIKVQDFVMQGLGPKPKPMQLANLQRLLSEWDLAADAHKSFHLLSGGQKTRAMIARALVSEPTLLCLDEPLASLDPCCQETLMKDLHRLAHGPSKVCVVMVDHHTDIFQKLLSAQIRFVRSHNSEVCTVRFESLLPSCCEAVL
jgi:ABC-type Mn2+/Zn2+ transport system ATPase subunit